MDLYDPTRPPQTVIRVIEDGCTIHDRLFHPHGCWFPVESVLAAGMTSLRVANCSVTHFIKNEILVGTGDQLPILTRSWASRMWRTGQAEDLANALEQSQRQEEIPMTSQKLEKSEWQSFFDALSRLLEAKQAEIEVDSLGLGNQVQAEWLALIGITYDPKDDLVEVALEGLDHMIRSPREIYAEGGTATMASIEIVGADGVKQIVRFRDQLLLPSRGGPNVGSSPKT